MSTTIDQNVVEMRFDNRHFEQNVSQSMSTLDKFKQKLNFTGATKGVEEIGTATEAMSVKVSHAYAAMQAQIVRWSTNVTQAVEKAVSALTIDPVTTGFQEYETQINSTQTILANTESKGSTIDDVNRALEELNTYADKTIYNFTEMTRNIGTFTAAGVDLETSVNAIQGIANLAAVSGSTSQQASTAMYQLSQALSSGTVKLMDWNSVVNAGMGGQVFQDALKETARAHGVAIDDMIEKQGSFRETLSDGWLTSEILTETLSKFTMATEGATEAEIKANREKLKSLGYTDEQIEGIFKLGNTATNAATKVKTFTQLWDVMKETAQSGWSQTWKIIVGDFEEAKALFTPLADTLTGFINKMSDARNRVLNIALAFADPVKTMMEKLNGAGFGKIKEAIKTVSDLSDKLEYYQEVVNKVWRGDFNNVGDDPDRYDLLTKAGYDPRIVQDLVNKGYQYKLTVDDIEASYKKFGVTVGGTKPKLDESGKAFKETAVGAEDTSKAIQKLTDEQLKNAGLTEDEIRLYRALEKEAERLGISVDDLADKMSKTDGRTLLIDSFKNFGQAIVDVAKIAADAWNDIFNPPSLEYIGVRLHSAIRALKEFSESLKLTDEKGNLNKTGEQIQRTFKGIFAAIDIVLTVIGGPLKIAFKVLGELLGYFDVPILELTANIGDALVAFRDWIDSMLDFDKVFDVIIPHVTNAIDAIKSWYEAFKQTPVIRKLVDAIDAMYTSFKKLFSGDIDVSKFAKTLGTSLAEAIKSIPGIALQIGKDFIAGFQNGIEFSISDIITNIINFCKEFVAGFAEALGVQSPSWKAYEIAVDFFQGFINGTTGMIKTVVDIFKAVGNKIIDVFKSFWDYITDESGNVEWDKIIAGGIIIASLWTLYQFAKAINGIADAFGSIGDLLENVSDAVKSFSKVLNAYAWDIKAKALQKMAIAVAILAASVFVLAQIDDIGKLWNAVGIIVVLAAVLVGLAIAMDKFSQASISIEKGQGINIDGLKTGLLQIGIAILLLAATVKIIGDMDPNKAKQGFIGLAGMAIGLLAFMALLGAVSKYSVGIDKFGTTMLLMSSAMLMMVYVIKAIRGLDAGDIFTGLIVMEAFVLLMIQMGLANRVAGQNGNSGGTMLAMSIAMLAMVAVIKIIAGVDLADVFTGLIVMEAFVLLMIQMGLVNRVAGASNKIGGSLLGMAVAMMLMTGVIKLLAGMDPYELLKGVFMMQAFALIIAEMLLIAKLGKNTGKVGGTILAMSVAVGILAGIAILLSMVDIGGLVKGIVAVGLLSALVAMMAKSLKGAQNVKGSIMMMAIAIGVMAASIVALSFIDTESLAGASAAISMVIGMFALMTKASNNVKASVGTMAIMLGVVLILAGILAVLGSLDLGSTLEIASSISLIMLAMAASLKIISGTRGDAMAGVGAMALMALVVGELGIILGLLAHFNVNPSIETVSALSVMLIAMSAALVILGAVGLMGPAAFVGIGALAVLIAGIGGLIAGIGALTTEFPKLEEFLNNGIPVIAKIGDALGQFFGNIIGGFLTGIGTGAAESLSKLIDGVRVFIDGLAEVSVTASGIQPDAFDGVGDLVEALLGVSVASLIEHFVSSITGESSMETFKTNALAFVDTVKAISDNLTAVSIADDKIETITKCGLMFAELNKSLPRTGGIAQDLAGEQDLAGFAESCKAFTAAMIEINTAVSMEGFEVQSDRISKLVAAGERFNELNTALPKTGGIAQDLAGEQDLAGFGAACSAFVAAMIEVNTAVSMEGFEVNSDRIADLVSAGEKFNELNTALPKTGGIAQDLAGKQDLAKFGASASAFAAAMIEVGNAVSGDDFVLDLTAIDTMKAAGEKFNELQNALPKTGGWWEAVAGESDLADFGAKIEAFGTALSTYSTSVTGLNNESIATSIITAYKIKTLVESLAGLDSSGLNSFAGVGLGDGHVVNIAQAMAKYGEEVADLNVEAVSVSVTAALKLKSLIESLAGLDTSGIENFKVASVGTAMKTYSDKVKDIDTGVVASSISSADRLKHFISGLTELDPSGIGNFKPASIGTAMLSYGTSVAGLNTDAIYKSITAAGKVRSFISSLANFNAGGVGSFVKAIDNLSTVQIDKMVQSFTNAADKLGPAGEQMMNGLIKGITGKIPHVVTSITKLIDVCNTTLISKAPLFGKAGTSMMDQFTVGLLASRGKVQSATSACLASAVGGLTSYYNSFYSAGSYLVDGFASGISANSYKAAAKAAAMANAAEKAARDALAINSPSKVFKEIGAGIPEGFAMGIDKMAGLAENSTIGMASSAINSVKDTVSRIADMINSDIDAQPTIRPVLDLSNVRTGVDAIGGMLGGSTMGVNANLSAINSMMGHRSQNGSNDDVVSAIDKLRKDIAKMPNNSYQINGVTYDDGSNIATAMQQIVRAAQVERRV